MEPEIVKTAVDRCDLGALRPPAPELPAHDPLLADFRSLHGRIGIYGGSFDPPHRGHIDSALAVMRARNLDAIVFVPATQNPLKRDATLATAEERVQMMSLICRELPGLYVSPIEAKRSGKSYTVDTLSEIAAQLPADGAVSFIFGSDVMKGFHFFRDYEKILAGAEIIMVGRACAELGPNDLQNLPEGSRAAIRDGFVPFSLHLSSTELRLRLKRGEPTPEIPPAVREFIQQRGLYRPKQHPFAAG